MYKDFIKNSGYTFVRFFGILWLSLLITILGFFIATFFIERKHELILDILQAILFFISTFGGCFLLARSDGYKSNLPFQKNDLPKYCFVFILHIIYAFCFGFAIYTTGAAYNITHIIWRQTGHEVKGNGSAPFWLYLIFLVVFDCIYLLAVIWGKKKGVQKRLSDRKKLLS